MIGASPRILTHRRVISLGPLSAAESLRTVAEADTAATPSGKNSLRYLQDVPSRNLPSPPGRLKQFATLHSSNG